MSREFQELIPKVEKAIKEFTISLPTKKIDAYEGGEYKPFFSLVDRGGKLLCMWCGNRRKPDKNGKGGDVEICRIRQPELGLPTDVDDPKGWDKITLKVLRHFNTKK